MSAKNEKKFQIYPKVGDGFAIRVSGSTTVSTDTIIFRDSEGDIIAAFPIAGLIGFWEESILVGDAAV